MDESRVDQLKKIKRSVFITLITFEVITIPISIFAIVRELRIHEKKFGSPMVAPGLGEIIAGLRMFNLFYIIIALLTIIPLLLLYQYFIGSKSIYTMLRLPGRYSRLKFYINQIKFSIKGILEIWLIQLILILLFYVLYIIVIPKISIVDGNWRNLWQVDYIGRLFPFTKPISFTSLSFMGLLLPNMSILLVLVERSRKRSILAVLGLIISVLGVYSYSTHSFHSFWILPVSTFLSVTISIYYIYRVEIV